MKTMKGIYISPNFVIYVLNLNKMFTNIWIDDYFQLIYK